MEAVSRQKLFMLELGGSLDGLGWVVGWWEVAIASGGLGNRWGIGD